MLVSLMLEHNLCDLFSNEFIALKELFDEIDANVQYKFPCLFDMMKRYGIMADIYAAKWIITMFAIDFPTKIVMSIMDMYMIDQKKVVIQVVLSVLQSISLAPIS